MQAHLLGRLECHTFFIVRACFPKLYHAIVEKLRVRQRIAIVSTSGTGNSTFVFYFATR